MEDALGSKASRGNICLAHDASTDGGINAEWIWNITEENKKIVVHFIHLLSVFHVTADEIKRRPSPSLDICIQTVYLIKP